jgi:glycosyltransferase involved in cell wall biosynthesis
MPNPLVSIIVTVYNKQGYLSTCINSLIAQTYNNLQIIIVDDGSTDESPQICNEYANADKRITVLHQANNGMCPARNAGLDVAEGEWIFIIDGDDYVGPRYVEYLLKAASENNALVAQGKNRITFASETSIEQPLYQCRVFDLTELVLYCECTSGYNNITLCDKIWHRSLFDNIRLPNKKNGHDEVTICELLWAAKDRKFAVVNQTLLFIRQTPDSMSRGRRTLFAIEEWKKAYIGAMEFWRDRGFWQIYGVFFKYAYCYSVSIACECMRDIPEHKDKIKPIAEFVENNIQEAISHDCDDAITIRYGAPQIWNQIINAKSVVLYAYGTMCQFYVFPWLMHFGAALQEIWDIRGDDSLIQGIPFRQPYAGLDKDTLIIITLANRFLSFQVEEQLRNLGYTKFISYFPAHEAIKYARIKKFLPFVLEERLTAPRKCTTI